MLLQDVTQIRTTPERIFAFFEEMDANYTRWHPDHILFDWVRGRGVREGNRFRFEERIGGHLKKQTFEFTRVEPNRHIEFAPTVRLIRWLMPRLSFHVDRQGDHCAFTARIVVRTGPLGARLNRREFDAVRRHMREEGENLKRLLEDADTATDAATHAATIAT
jgi:hypothetical protein